MTFVPAPDPVGFRRLDPIRARDAGPGTRPPTPLLVTATATTDRDTGRIATAGGIASAVAHGALILWLLLGGRIFQPAHAPEVAAVSVSVLTTAEFAALTAPQPAPPPDPPQAAPPPAEADPAPALPPRPADLDPPADLARQPMPTALPEDRFRPDPPPEQITSDPPPDRRPQRRPDPPRPDETPNDQPRRTQPRQAAPAPQAATGQPAPAVAAASPGQIDRLKAKWGAEIRQRVQRRTRAARGMSGEVAMLLVVDRSGALISVGVARSSGNPRLDAMALRAVRAAGRFPPAPAGLTDASYSLSLPISFVR